ncbi:MAG TPA: type II secretion system protein [Chthoniobacteraceae bacterium]|nr:type II secretion system protein [Chthoniobacteraceae bacterium]
MKSAPRNQRGLTQLELLMVLVILAILGILAIPVSNRARETTNGAKNVANLKAIGAASLAFAADHEGVLPSNGANLNVRNTSLGSGLSLSGGPPRHLISRKRWLGLAPTDYLHVTHFYSPFAEKYAREVKEDFFQLEKNSGRIGYLFYSLPRRSSNNKDLVPGLYNDTVRENPRAPLYSDFCLDSRENVGFRSPNCSVVYLDGHVEIFSQEEVSRHKASWSYVIQYFAGMR